MHDDDRSGRNRFGRGAERTLQLIYIIVFGILGLWLAEVDETVLGMGVGAFVGYLLGRIRGLQLRVGELDEQLSHIHGLIKQAGQRVPTEKPGPASPPVSLFEPEPAPEPVQKPVSPPVSGSKPDLSRAQKPLDRPVPKSKWQAPESEVSTTSAISPVEKILTSAKEWISTGNVPVKVGVIVSFFGVSFLLKYAVERQFIVFPIEARYLAVAIGAGVLLAIGWRLRDQMQAYALSMQGGGIGILYLTIFSAFRVHPLLPAPFAFALLVLLTAFTGMLAVLQNARWLAIFGTVGGFLAPVLVSTGSGNHVALFSYYLLLNAAILGIAWHKAWRMLNLIGFAFTFGVGTMWGYQYYRPELFASTEPFLILFFLFYQAIAILFAFRQRPELRGLVDGTLVFGTPVIAFALQARLVDSTEYGLAISAVTLAVFYTLVGSWLQRMRKDEMRLLIESYIALAIAFATIAVPLALDDRWTAVAWALEGAALVWVGVRQNGFLARLTGAALLAASGIAFMAYGWRSDAGIAVFNGNFLGGMLISVAALFSARRLAVDESPVPMQSIASGVLFLWGLGWWVAIGSAEILDRISGNDQAHALLAFAAASAALLTWLARRLDWTIARHTTLGYLPALGVLGILYLVEFGHVLVNVGTLSWIAAAIVHFAILRAYDNGRGKLEAYWHFAGALSIAAMLVFEIEWRMDQAGFSEVWRVSTAMLVPLAGSLLITFGRDRVSWPLQRYWSAYLLVASVLVALQLLAIGIAGTSSAANPAPLPYIPVLNPFDMLTFIGLAVALHVAMTGRATTDWLAKKEYHSVMISWGIAAFILSTIAVIRGVHNLGDIEWHQNALMRTVAVQSSLSIFWAVLGLSGMVWGARHAKRWVWMMGTALMALVVVKLFLVDLGNTGTVARIISFLGVGVMLLVVGYFAPAPPRQSVGPELLAEE